VFEVRDEFAGEPGAHDVFDRGDAVFEVGARGWRHVEDVLDGGDAVGDGAAGAYGDKVRARPVGRSCLRQLVLLPLLSLDPPLR
jgi:hypothetical protein